MRLDALVREPSWIGNSHHLDQLQYLPALHGKASHICASLALVKLCQIISHGPLCDARIISFSAFYLLTLVTK